MEINHHHILYHNPTRAPYPWPDGLLVTCMPSGGIGHLHRPDATARLALSLPESLLVAWSVCVQVLRTEL